MAFAPKPRFPRAGPPPKKLQETILVTSEPDLRKREEGRSLWKLPCRDSLKWFGCRKQGRERGWGPRAALLPSAEHQWGRRVGFNGVGWRGEEMRINTSEQRGKGRGAAASAPWQPMKGSDTQ